MDDLADELGMSKKTLYAHFPSKESLLKAVLLAKIDDVESDLARLTKNSSDNVALALQQVLICIQGHTEEIQPPFLRDIQRDAPEMFLLVSGRRQEMIQKYIGKLLTEGRRDGLIRRDIPVRLIVEILLACVQSIINPGKLTQLGVPPRSAYTAIMTVVLEGAFTKGRSPRTP